MKSPSKAIRYLQFNPDRSERIDSEIIVETPVTLTVNGEDWLTFMCTPVDLEAMAVGFLFNEGLIKRSDDIASVHLCASGDILDIWTYQKLEKPTQWRRTTGCTGGVTAVETDLIARPALNGATLSAASVGELIGQLFESQQLYRSSGGVHTSALSDGQHICVVAEDIGRHNTLDKLAGRVLLDKISLPQRIILTTGRISSEMLQKSARLSAAIVISRTSPSSLSIEMAEYLGITLIGYARRNRFNVYTHPERILIESEMLEIETEPIFP